MLATPCLASRLRARVALAFSVATVLLAAPAFGAQEPVIVGVTNLGQAIAALRARGTPIHQVIHVSNALAVTGDPITLRSLPFVRYVEADPPDAAWIQADTLEYGIDNIEAEVVWGGLEGATSVLPGQGGAGIKVAVIDTGIDCQHEDLAPGCSYGLNALGSEPPVDDHGHGTHVAGIIAARANGVGFIGVAPEASLYAVKVLNSNGSGPWSAVAAGINWAIQNGMQVINMSLGGSPGSQALADAVAAAEAAGILVVSAAGNSGCCNTVMYPAKYPESMAIAAVDRFDMRASFSSTGPELDVAAPGVAIRSSVPTGSCSLCDPTGYRSLSGTSMATPHVSGTGALLIARGWSNREARALISGTARDLGDPGFDQLYGYGRADALAAVTGTPPPPPPPPSPPPAPIVSITSPLNGATVPRRSVVSLQAQASDDLAVTKVDFYVNGALQCSVQTAPYTCAWKVPASPNRTYQLRARAYDADANVGVADAYVTAK